MEKNRAFAPDFTPNDAYYPNQWHLPQIKAPQAWDITQGATPPGASISSPVNGATLSGTICVSIQASDNIGTTVVELYLDGD